MSRWHTGIPFRHIKFVIWYTVRYIEEQPFPHGILVYHYEIGVLGGVYHKYDGSSMPSVTPPRNCDSFSPPLHFEDHVAVLQFEILYIYKLGDHMMIKTRRKCPPGT